MQNVRGCCNRWEAGWAPHLSGLRSEYLKRERVCEAAIRIAAALLARGLLLSRERLIKHGAPRRHE